jgi:hypothetical protein
MKKQGVTIPIQSDLLTIKNIDLLPEYIQFIQWSATPKQFRNPKTQKEFADTIGVCEDTLTNWKKHNSFLPLFQKSLKSWIIEHSPDVIGSLYANACDFGRDIDTYLKIVKEINK